MKKQKHQRLIVALALLALASFIAGCATMEAHNTKSLLSAAGFKIRKPETPKQHELYNALENNRLARATYNGRTFYVFKDADDGIAYVGHEAEYQRYQNLCIQQKIAQDYYMASTMNSYYARGWYGAWGPRGMYW